MNSTMGKWVIGLVAALWLSPAALADQPPGTKKEAQFLFAGLFSCAMGQGQAFKIMLRKNEDVKDWRHRQHCVTAVRGKREELYEARGMGAALYIGCAAGLRTALATTYTPAEAKRRIKANPKVADLVVSLCKGDSGKLFLAEGFDQTSYDKLIAMIAKFSAP